MYATDCSRFACQACVGVLVAATLGGAAGFTASTLLDSRLVIPASLVGAAATAALGLLAGSATALVYLEGQLMTWKKGSSAPLPARENPILKERCLTYFPQSQTYAADVTQVAGAVGLITIGETTTLVELLQAVWRMRGLKKEGQSLLFVMTKEVQKRICGEGQQPTTEQILLFTQKNGSEQEPDAYKAARDKIHDVVRSAILDKLLSSLPLDEAIALGPRPDHLFLTTVEEDPFFLFGMIDAIVSPDQLLEEMKKVYMPLLRTEAALFTPEELAESERQLHSIGKGSYPDQVHVYRKEGELQLMQSDDQEQAMELHQEQETHRQYV